MSEPGLYVVAAPSGGGKTSLIKALLESDDRVRLSVSHTTRPPRPGEVHGQHYFFVSEKEFIERAGRGSFLEHAEVFDHRYGTGREAVECQLRSGYDVILDIDWQGARQIRQSFPSCRTIFILPPSLQALQERLTRRGQDSKETIQRRMRDAKSEISHWNEFDFLIINDDFGEALEDLRSIIRNGHPARRNQDGRIGGILAELLENG